MAYNGGYEAQGRPYAGPAAARPAPQQRQQYPPGPPGSGGPQQQYNGPPPQQYDQYQDDYDYGYDDGYGGNGYDQGYGEQYDDMNYGRPPPPNQNYPPQQDYYGPPPGRGGAPRGRGRGGPMGRPPPPGGQYPPRSGGPGPGRGGYPPQRGGRPPVERHGNSDPTPHRRPPMDPMSPSGGGAYPNLPGGRPKNDMQDMSRQMEGMNISNGQRPPPGRNGMAPPRGPPPGDGYGGRPPMDGRGPRQYPPQDYPDQRRGPPPPGPGYGAQDGYPDENFGPPARSMTMPAREPQMEMRSARPPPRGDSIPYNAPRPGPGPGRGMGMPPRPSTAQAVRQPPQDMYPPNNGPASGAYGEQAYDNGPDAGYRGQQQRPASYDDFYDYYDRDSGDYSQAQPHRGSGQSGMGGFDQPPAPPQHVQSPPMQNGTGQPQRVAARVPEVSRTKSQPDLRQPQAAVFEMAGDMPPVPTQYQQQQPPRGPPQQGQGYGQHGTSPGPGPGAPYQEGQYGRRRSYDQGGPVGGQPLPNNPAQYRPGPQPSSSSVHSASSADTHSSHPPPVRAGLMPGSVVNLSSGKPPPVRNYNGGINGTGAPPANPPQQVSQQAQMPVQQQPHLPQQPAIQTQAPPAKPKEPAVTVEELDRLKAKFKTSPADQENALTLGKKLCEAAEVLPNQLPDPKARVRAKEKYLLDAQKILKKLCSNGNMHAMFFMADCLGRGLFGAEPDNKEAFLLYQSAAKQGHAAAAYRTAVCCEIGNEEGGGTRKDPLKAIQWYKRAAMLGDTPAMYKVGMILLKGLVGQPRNPREAIGWLKRAAERADAENPHALHELGLLYESAEGNDAIVRDEGYAFRLFKQAADLGYKFSQYRMGAAYEYGLMGVPPDARLSIMWYSRAATQEEHQSELALSGWYLTGSEGVLGQSDTEAYLWARKAAIAGLAKAEYAMGYFTEVGIGVPADVEGAKRWYWRAAAQDFPKARERLEDLKRSRQNGPRQRERISRSKIEKQQEGDCVVM